MIKADFELALAVRDLGDLAEAEHVLRRVLAKREARLGPGHPDTLRTREALAGLAAQAGATLDVASA